MSSLDFVAWCCLQCHRPHYGVRWWAERDGCGHGEPWRTLDNATLPESERRYPKLDRVVVGPLPAWAMEAIAA